MLKKILLFIPLCLFTLLPVSAQSWASKAVKSLLTLKTFSKDGTLLASSTGFFVGTDGEAVSSYAPFKGAQRAVVIDAQGKEYPVEFMLGANETYDVAKLRLPHERPPHFPLQPLPRKEAVYGSCPMLSRRPPTAYREPSAMRSCFKTNTSTTPSS